MKRPGLLIFQLFLVVFIIGGVAYLGRDRIVDVWNSWMENPVPEPVTLEEAITLSNTSRPEPETDTNTGTEEPEPEPEIVLAEEFNLDVPFTTQSPFAEWTEQDNESCEEASALMVHFYWQGKTFTKQRAKEELQAVIDFENAYFGYYKDTTAEETAEFMREMWGYERVNVRYDVSIEAIKKEIAQGRPVILPAAGRSLGNPNFRDPGPLYHMVVARGWTTDTIITNDPGTRNGENYQYDPDVLYDAIHDWNGGDVDNGQKAMIVVYPND